MRKEKSVSTPDAAQALPQADSETRPRIPKTCSKDAKGAVAPACYDALLVEKNVGDIDAS
jgi:hypothetical protein